MASLTVLAFCTPLSDVTELLSLDRLTLGSAPTPGADPELSRTLPRDNGGGDPCDDVVDFFGCRVVVSLRDISLRTALGLSVPGIKIRKEN